MLDSATESDPENSKKKPDKLVGGGFTADSVRIPIRNQIACLLFHSYGFKQKVAHTVWII
jgi:hypothetical protein